MLDHFNVKDFSCEICKPISYVDFIVSILGDKNRCDASGEFVLTALEVDTFLWMLSDVGIVVDQINQALYGEEAQIRAVR
jgi:hypothetical protein